MIALALGAACGTQRGAAPVASTTAMPAAGTIGVIHDLPRSQQAVADEPLDALDRGHPSDDAFGAPAALAGPSLALPGEHARHDARALRHAPAPTVAAPAHVMPSPGPAPGGGGLGAALLPTSGVLASNFVGGHGAEARLEDLLDRGVVVDGQHVRLEALDDVGRLPYAVPTKAVAVYAELERAKLLAGGERVHLQIALLAREGEMPVRPHMDVRLVLDRSGSMGGEKWVNALAAARALVDRLSPTDTFGLVSYSDTATTDLAPARVGDRRAAHAAIDRLVTGGGTNIDAALAAVQAQPPVRHGASDVALVVLLSDGCATVGQTNADELGARSRALFDAGRVLTTTVGVGTDFDENTMLTIAREGSGSYHFVRRSEDIAGILTDELEERAQAVAQDLRLRIELAPGVTATRVYGSRLLDDAQAADVRATEVALDEHLAHELGIPQDRQHDDQRGLRMYFPTFRRGDQHVVLMELLVPPGASTTSVARVSLDFKDLVHGQNDHATVAVTAERTGDAAVALASTRRPVKRTVLAFQAGDALQAAAAALDRGDLAAAHQTLDERIALLSAGRDLWRDHGLERDLAILGQYDHVLGSSSSPAYDGESRHTLALAMNFYGDRRMQ